MIDTVRRIYQIRIDSLSQHIVKYLFEINSLQRLFEFVVNIIYV